MRTKAWLLFVVLLSGAEVCAQDPREFFPLRVGNYWEYQYDEFYVYFKEFVRAVGETVMPNGKRYVILHHRFSNGSSGGSYDYWRIDDSANVFWYDWRRAGIRGPDSTDILFDKLGAMMGEVWRSFKYCLSCDPSDVLLPYAILLDSSATRITIEYSEFAPPPQGLFLSRDYFQRGVGLSYREYEAYGKQELLGAIIDGDTVGVVSSVEQGTEIGSPAALKLFQNFPNPFNSNTQIRFELHQRGIVRLAIYDLLGREVRRLIDQERQPGEYFAGWDGRNGLGESASSGIYLCRLQVYSQMESVNSVRTAKMILLR